MPYPLFRRKSVCLPPPPSTGIHKAIFAHAAKLRDSGFSLQSVLIALLGWRDSYQFRRNVPLLEIQDAVNSAFKRCGSSQAAPFQKTTPITLKWPQPNPQKRSTLLDPDFGLYDLWESSPVRFDGNHPNTREILEALFPNDPLVCCGSTMRRFETKRLSQWQNLEKLQLLVPSPMSKPLGKVRNGDHLSSHTLDNTGNRRFLVIDFDDHAGPDTHASASLYLAQKYPLVLVLHSGGKSLHSWYYVEGVSETEIKSFMSTACTLAGDPALFTKSQFCRMPGGTRRDRDPNKDGARQTVYYFDPEAATCS